MKKTFFLLAFLFLVGLWSTRCSTGTCNNVLQRPLPSTTPSPSPYNLWPSPTPKPEVLVPKEPTVLVFKTTGERQCETGGGIGLDDMKAQLTTKKIPVYEAHTQADGLMHMALCGTPSGTIHIFMIPASQKKKALKSGFKIFTPRP